MAKLQKFQNLVDGKRVDGEGGETFESFDPYLGKPWSLIPRSTPRDVDTAVTAAHRAFTSSDWAGLTASARGKLLVRFADLLEANAERLAALETHDNGKLIAEMSAQLKYIPEWYRYFGGLADKIEGAVLPMDKPGLFAFTRHEPLGVIAAITAWNSPLLLLSWKLAPALAAGNTVVAKPSEFASASTLEFVSLFEEAGFPSGVVNTVTGFGAEIGTALTTHPLVAKVAFTGGDGTGQRVYEAASSSLKRVSLELGGKSPNIIFADANLDNAVNGAISGIFAASGQTCMAGSRLLVDRKVHDEVIDRLTAIASSARIGDPANMDTQVGPITTLPQRAHVLKMIDAGKKDGAKIILGGGEPDAPDLADGWFVEPTIFTGVNNQMDIAQQEIFGPVLSIIVFEGEDEAVSIANDTIYGLASGVWTSDIGRGIRMSERLQSGTVWINAYRAVSYMAPFGGYKRSGIGRENGQSTIMEYLQTKTVWMDTSGTTGNPFILR